MGNIEFFKKEITQEFKNHLKKELGSKALTFIKDEINIFLNKKIEELKKPKNDYTVQPQYTNRKDKNPNQSQWVRE